MAERAGETFLGLDIGTSSVKALLVDVAQRVVAEASVPLSVSRPHALWSEQDPSDWVDGVEAAVAVIRERAPSEFAALSGVGLSGHMHGATLLDAEDKPLRPAILWNDGRSFAECAELKRRVPDLEERTGNLAMPGFTAPKMLWVAEHEPEIARATRRVLLPKDYVRLRLSGEAVSEMSDASGTLWLDVGRRRWDETLLAATGLTEKAMPSLVEGSEVSAHLAPDVAAAWGLGGRKVPIAGGGGDNAASAIGVGGDRAGRGVRFARHLGRHLFRHRPLREPARAHAACVLPRAAASLARDGGDAVGRLLARLDRRRPWTRERHRRLDRRRRRFRPVEGRGRLRADLPALSQRRAHAAQRRRGDRNVRRPASRARADALVFAVMEGVAFSFADGVDVLDAAGARPVRPLLVGGGARSEFWGQMIADVTGLDDRSRFRRGSGRGARRGEAWHAGGRRRKHRGGLPASAHPARVRSRRRARRGPRRAAQALPRALQGREGRAALSRHLQGAPGSSAAGGVSDPAPQGPRLGFLGAWRLRLETPRFGPWISLDCLGFSRPKSSLFNELRWIFAE